MDSGPLGRFHGSVYPMFWGINGPQSLALSTQTPSWRVPKDGLDQFQDCGHVAMGHSNGHDAMVTEVLWSSVDDTNLVVNWCKLYPSIFYCIEQHLDPGMANAPSLFWVPSLVPRGHSHAAIHRTRRAIGCVLYMLYVCISVYIYGPVSRVPTPPHGMGGYDAPVVVYIHTYIPTYLPTYLHTYVHTYIPLHYLTLHYLTLHSIHTYIPLHYLTLHYLTLHYLTLHSIHTYIHTNIPTYQHTNIPAYQHTNIPTYHHHRPQGGGPEEPYHHHRPQGGGPEEPYHHHGPQGGGPEEPDDTVHPYPLVGGGGGWPTLHHIYI